MPTTTRSSIADEFVGLIHAFGVLKTDSTPCGQPMSVSTAHAICELAQHGPLTQTELAARIGLSTSSVSRLIDQLVRKAWATRHDSAAQGDKRLRHIALTRSGDDAARKVLAARAERFDDLLAAIDPARHAQVLESLHLLKEAADELR